MTVTDTSRVEAQAFDNPDESDDESWLASSQPKGMRVRVPLAVLTLALAVILGMWGGAKLEARQNPATVTATATATSAGRAGGAFGGGGNAAPGGLTGTVASVEGSTIKLTTTGGSTVTITLLPSTAITRTAAAATTDITAGETITVRGPTGADGSTTAQTVVIVPAS